MQPPTASTTDADSSAVAGEFVIAVDARAARQGDRAAFARLHQRFAPMVNGIALARMPHREASDLVQETFLHALEQLSLLRDDSAFGPWLATIARNLANEFHRRRIVRPAAELPDMPDAMPHMTSPDDVSIERARALLKAIRALPDAYAETLTLRLVEGLTGPQIAACTGLTHGSVRVNLTRGMQLLRERMQQMKIDQEDSP